MLKRPRVWISSVVSGILIEVCLKFCGKHDSAHDLPVKVIATNVPDKVCGYGECNGLIVQGKVEREWAGCRENRQMNPSYLT